MAQKADADSLGRRIRLLWGNHPRPGRSGLTVDAIVRAGSDLADAEGLDAVSMRKVADCLGVGAMSLYGHVPGKDDLTALMVDAVYAQLYDSVDEPARSGDWRAAMRVVTQRNWALFERHPWLLDVRLDRPTLGPHASGKYEAELRPLDGIGLTDIQMDATLNLVLSHVEATARLRRARWQSQRESALTDAQWWAIVGPVLESVADADTLVVSSRVGTAAGTEFDGPADPAFALGFGLDTILDGIAARIGA